MQTETLTETNKQNLLEILLPDLMIQKESPKMIDKKEVLVRGKLKTFNSQSTKSIVEVENDENREIFILFTDNSFIRGLEEDKVLVKLMDIEDLSEEQLSSIPEYVFEEKKEIGIIIEILDRVKDQTFVGKFIVRKDNKDDENKKEEPRFLLFKPNDKRIPIINVINNKDFNKIFDGSDDYKNFLFSVKITKWKFGYRPLGIVDTIIGEVPQKMNRKRIETDVKATLYKNNLKQKAFPNQIYKEIKALQQLDPDLDNRIDYRGELVFTIDPPSAKYLDDAVSCKRICGNLYEIGVHIADITHFIKQGSELDKAAAQRSTSIYLLNKSIPMLPFDLSEKLLSLLPDKDSLCFSVFLIMDQIGNVKDTKFGKSIIRSRCKISYTQAQKIIDGNSSKDVLSSYDLDDTVFNELDTSIRTMYDLSQHLRKYRLDNGSLFVSSVKLKFKWNADYTIPLEWNLERDSGSKKLIEEFMLLANTSVADKIISHLPDSSLLRRHPSPRKDKLEKFADMTRNIGYHMDIYNSLAINKSFERMEDLDEKIVLKKLFRKTMKRATYFCSSQINKLNEKLDKDTWGSHFSLDFLHYTHFTSPIRRYSDIIVHRQLDYCLKGKGSIMDSKEIEERVDHINYVNKFNSNAQDKINHLSLAYHFHHLSTIKPAIFEAVVHDFGYDSISVTILPLGTQENIRLNKMEHITFTRDKDFITVNWGKLNQTQSIEANIKSILSLDIPVSVQVIKIFQRIYVEVKVDISLHPPRINVFLVNKNK